MDVEFVAARGQYLGQGGLAATVGCANQVEMDATDRNRIVASAFGIAMDHHAAIVVLMRNTLYSSGFALLRVLFEAYLR